MKQIYKVLSLSLLVATIFVFAKTSGVHAATTISVNSTADTAADNGECTFREAIISANTDTPSGSTPGECAAGSGTDTINFTITGTADYTMSGQDGYIVTLGSNLPDITQPVTIDGYSQQGATPNSNTVGKPFNGRVLIEIDANHNADTLFLKASNSIVKGLSLINFREAGLCVQDSANSQVAGNLVGLRPNGAVAGNGLIGVGLIGRTNGVRVGGANASDRNVISGNGTNANMLIQPAGVAPSDGNENDIIQGNYIGTNLDGTISSTITNPNGINVFAGASDNLIGGASRSEANIIVANEGYGIGIYSFTVTAMSTSLTPAKNAILGNAIYSNVPGNANVGTSFNAPGLGIDLFGVTDNKPSPDFTPNTFDQLGPTINDTADTDTGPNGYINFPVLNKLTQSGAQAIINFDLDAADSPSGKYRLEFFGNDEADSTGYGEGQIYLGSVTVANGANQQAALPLPSGYSLSGKYITATTTAVDGTTTSGFGSTSEFSKAITLGTENALADTGISATMLLTIGLTGILVGYSMLRYRSTLVKR